MGNFYTNFTLRGPSQQAVAKALAGRSAIVTPAQDGSVVVFDEQSDEQDQAVIAELAARLSREFGCPLLAVLNHDDDIFWYQLYLSGELADEYDSSPGYFDASAGPSAPAGGDAHRLCAAFGASNVPEVESVLRKRRSTRAATHSPSIGTLNLFAFSAFHPLESAQAIATLLMVRCRTVLLRTI